MKNTDSNFSTNFNSKPKLNIINTKFQKPFGPNININNNQLYSINDNNNISNNNGNDNIAKNNNLNYQEQMKKIYEERQKIQNRIKKLDNEEKNNYANNKNLELRQAQLSYCKDPFRYMDYLLEQHFKNTYINNKDDEKIKKKVQEDYENFQKGLIDDFTIFKNRQKVFLEKLQDKYYVINRKKNNINFLDENAQLVSEPLYQGEDIKNIFNQLPQHKYNLIINSPGDTKNELINDVNSNLYKNKLCKGVIQCMAGGGCKPDFLPPNKKYLEVNNVKMNRDFYIEGKKDFNTKRYKEKLEKDFENNIFNNQEKTVNLQNKLFDVKYNNYLNGVNEIENKNEEYFKIINDIKDQMTKDELFNILTQKQLNIFKKSKEEIKDILTQKNNDYKLFEFNLVDENCNEKEKKLKEEYFKKMNEANAKFDNDVQKINNEIEKLEKKYGFYNKERNKYKNNINKGINNKNNKKRNISSYIGNRKYYNDNPYHYNYDYNGASIPIKKTLNKFPD